MKKIVLIYGLIAGLIAGGWAVSFIYFNRGKMDYDNGMIYGYTAMLVGFALIFVGIKNYRDNQLGGYIKFGKAFQVGLLITLVASTVYVVLWLIESTYFVTNFIESWSAHEIQALKDKGASAAAIAAKEKEMAEFAVMYSNPFYKILMTYAEIFPVGLLISLFAALIMKKSPGKDNIATA